MSYYCPAIIYSIYKKQRIYLILLVTPEYMQEMVNIVDNRQHR